MKFGIVFIVIALGFGSCKSLQQNKYKNTVSEHNIMWDEQERTYYVYVPKTAHDKPLPVLFNLHGGGGTALGTIGLSFGRFNELAEEHGFIVVYPDAIDKSWNDGRTSDTEQSWKDNVDDVGFLSQIVAELNSKHAIDAKRIFTTGMSNGGFMSSRLLCDRADLFRGGAIVTATISEDYFPKCKPSQPVGVLVMNGTDDPLVPYNGGPIRVFKKDRGTVISTDSFMQFWAEHNGCVALEYQKTIDRLEDGTEVVYSKALSCDPDGITGLYRINGGGHTWPGGRQYLGEGLIGRTSQEINACDVIWNFFESLD